MRASEFLNEDEPIRIKLNNNDAAKAFIEKVYTKYPYTMQNNHVMVWGKGDEQQFAMFELIPSFSKRGAVEVKWFQAYPLRQGVGSKAMKELQAMAREDDIALTLFPWDKGQVSQSKLTKFYKGQGFKPAMKGSKNMVWSPELNEVFTSNVSSEVVRATPDLYTTKATIGGRVIVFNASQYDDDEGKSVWEIDFTEYEKDGTGTTFRKTGSGNELQVFSFVIESIKDLISSYHPDQLTFTSHKADDNRTKLYQRMLNRIKVPGYHAAPVDSGEYDDYFKIVKDNLDEAEVATKNSNEIWKKLRAAGYHHVGSGADATVFAKDDSHVIKILMPEDAGSKAEQIFRKFYEFSTSHQDLPCVPRFNEVNTIDINGKDYTQIEMERLSPIEKGGFLQGMVWLLSDYVSGNKPWSTVESELTNGHPWYFFSPNYSGTFARTWQSILENPASKKTYSMYKQLYTVMQLLFSTGNINKFGWDLHTANVMQRSNGQPVIIDPWFSEGTS